MSDSRRSHELGETKGSVRPSRRRRIACCLTTSPILFPRTSQRASNERSEQSPGRSRLVADEIAQLESREWSMWLVRHPTDELDSKKLLGEFEAKAQSDGASVGDKACHKLLLDLREKRDIVASSEDRDSQLRALETKALPVITSTVQVRELLFHNNSRTEARSHALMVPDSGQSL